MNKFKVGDRVEWHVNNKMHGIIIEVGTRYRTYTVDWDEGRTTTAYGEWLILDDSYEDFAERIKDRLYG